MTFNLFGQVVIGNLWEATAHKFNKEYQREENNEGENNNYVAGVTLKGTVLIHQWLEDVYRDKWRANSFLTFYSCD